MAGLFGRGPLGSYRRRLNRLVLEQGLQYQASAEYSTLNLSISLLSNGSLQSCVLSLVLRGLDDELRGR